MKKQELRLEFIENGRLSYNEMNEIYGGIGISCKIYTVSKKKGKSYCELYRLCTDMDDISKFFQCGSYSWAIAYDENAEDICYFDYR